MLACISGTETSEERKHELHIHTFGADEQCIFHTFPFANAKYEIALAVLKNFVVPEEVNVVANYKFCQGEQKPGELTVQYIAALRDLTVSCDY